MPCILLIDDNPNDRLLAIRELKQEFPDLEIHSVVDAKQLAQSLTAGHFDCVVTDYQLGWSNGLEVLKVVKTQHPDYPVIMFTDSGSEEVAVEGMKAGLSDYVLKRQHSRRLAIAVRKSLEKNKLHQEYAAALEQLKASEERYRTISNLTSDYAYSYKVGPEGQLVMEWVTAAFTRITGYTIEAVQTQGWQRLIHPDDFPQVSQFAQLVRSGQAGELEYRIVTRQGEVRWIRNHIQPIKEPDTGKIVRLYGAAQDISDRKQREAAQRFLADASSVLVTSLDSKTTLSNIAHLAGPTLADFCFIDIFTIDQQIQRAAWHHVDPAKQAWFDQVQRFVPSPSFQGNPVADVLFSGKAMFVPKVSDEWMQSIAISAEHLQFLRDSQVCSWITVPLSTHGQQLGALTLCFNAQSGRHYTPHELHLAEDLAHRLALALFNAQLYHQAQETNRIKDEFLAVLSHELRSPLNPILGWTKLLRTRKLDPATVDNALETIERNAKLQAQLVEDLLDVSRILQGKLCLDARPVNLVSTIAAALETVYLAAQAKSIQIQTKLDPGVRPILGDANRLQQVIWNLLSNAVKFTPPGGQVEIRLEQVEGDPKHSPSSSAFSPAQYVQVTITDTGKGINPEFLPYVFDYFRQADSATTRAFGGLGLGLAIVRHLVELHGGAVQVNSAGEDRGATFTVRLPIARDQVITQEQEQPEPLLDLQGVQVLVVDDNADMREFLSFMLKQYGAVVMTVASATEALQALIQSKPDILLSDVGMADVDGYMLIRQVRALSPEQGGQTPAIALTAYASEIDYQQALSSGFQMHISKPVEPDQLVKAISTLIQRD